MTPTVEATAGSPQSEAQWQREVDRCRDEIAAAEALLLAGHPEVEGLCMALADWSAELRILESRSSAAGSWNPAQEEFAGWPAGRGNPRPKVKLR